MSALNFNKTLKKTDPQQHPVLIVGQLRHLSILKFENVQCKLSPRVSEEIFQYAITCLHPSPTDFCPLYLDLATIAALPIKCSRHNTSSRSHAITRLVKTHTMNVTETILVNILKLYFYFLHYVIVFMYILYIFRFVSPFVRYLPFCMFSGWHCVRILSMIITTKSKAF